MKTANVFAMVLGLASALKGAGPNEYDATNLFIYPPLTLSGVDPFVETNAYWWTNSPVPTNIYTWQAWWSENENWARLQNWTQTNLPPAVADAITNSWRNDITNIVPYILAGRPELTSGQLTSAGRTNLVNGYAYVDTVAMFNDVILLTYHGTSNHGALVRVGLIDIGVGFPIYSSDPNDTNEVSWAITTPSWTW